MTNVLIAFYSRDGATEARAKAVAEGGRAACAEVRMRRARELAGPEIMAAAPTEDDLAEARYQGRRVAEVAVARKAPRPAA